MLAASVVMLLCSAIGVPVWSIVAGAKTPICTSSHLSPSMMSSPALAGDHVAAVAAEDDVAAGEGGDAGAEHGLQPCDQGDALRVEHAAEVACGAAVGQRSTICGHVVGSPPGRR